LPRNPAGKVLKTELRVRFGAAPETDGTSEKYFSPEDPG